MCNSTNSLVYFFLFIVAPSYNVDWHSDAGCSWPTNQMIQKWAPKMAATNVKSANIEIQPSIVLCSMQVMW